MSRIGKQPIELPSGVTCTVDGRVVTVKGPKGELQTALPPKVSVQAGTDAITIAIPDETDSRQNAFWGLGRSLIANMVQGVTEGFSKQLEVNGVGYKVSMKGSTLVLNVGYSHPVEFTSPEGVTIATEGNMITVSGINKQMVGETASQIRKVRKPEPYKGKGIKYTTETVRRKAGKVMKGSEG